MVDAASTAAALTDAPCREAHDTRLAACLGRARSTEPALDSADAPARGGTVGVFSSWVQIQARHRGSIRIKGEGSLIAREQCNCLATALACADR